MLHVLLTELGEPLASAFVGYWKRILTEGSALPRGSRETVGIEILARDGDDVGAATANFYNSLHEKNNDAARYILRSDDFVCTWIVRPKPFGSTKKLTAVSPPTCSFPLRSLPVRLGLPCNRLESQKGLDLAPRA